MLVQAGQFGLFSGCWQVDLRKSMLASLMSILTSSQRITTTPALGNQLPTSFMTFMHMFALLVAKLPPSIHLPTILNADPFSYMLLNAPPCWCKLVNLVYFPVAGRLTSENPCWQA